MKRFLVPFCFVLLIATAAYAGSNWPASKIIGALDLGTGTIRGGVSVETASGNGTESATVGQWVFVTGTATRTLRPVATSGQSICYYATTASVLTIDPSGSDVIVLAGTVQTGGVTIVSPGAAGNFVCFLSNGTNWYALGVSGAWSTGS